MKTSWESSHKWYNALVGEKGHYYHDHVVLPNALRLLDLKPRDSLLDLGCGQGILERSIPKQTNYVGVDASSSLVKAARKTSNRPFYVADITQPLEIKETGFSHAALILVTQNLEFPLGAFQNSAHFLKPGGKLLIVLNHPCFRIPRQSSWGVDEQKRLQYRRMDRYMDPLKIPIQTHPGSQKDSPLTYSFHHPLSFFINGLKESGFVIETLEEWISDKKSEGGRSGMENRARKEFPLFMAILAKKI
ncbi:class I SAM-dependent methyltransferase [Rhabdochlamydiaceae symbiont of Dictyostelium giganteum]|uniref:class I SAM-dependent methyltransferase n=1 Tax=Rhabdochlamydiaceae symbiont of Dictyostelium giganteum TaxID=3342349 RepID=UPI003850C99C